MIQQTNNDANTVHIESLGLKLNQEHAYGMGITRISNNIIHKELYDEERLPGWSGRPRYHPNNLILNRLDGDMVISSIIEFYDEYAMNVFVLKYLYEDYEGSLSSVKKCFVN